MTKDEIKKALECCSNPSINSCKNCPYNNNSEFSCCDGEMYKDALNLITEQEEEIERLKDDYAKLQEQFAQYQMASDKEIIAQKKQAEKRIDNLKRDYSNAFERLKSQQQEIDALKAENEELTKVVSSKVYDFIENIKEIAGVREVWEQQAKIDVLNELKSKSYVNDYCREVIEVEKIDELLKEYEK